MKTKQVEPTVDSESKEASIIRDPLKPTSRPVENVAATIAAQLATLLLKVNESEMAFHKKWDEYLAVKKCGNDFDTELAFGKSRMALDNCRMLKKQLREVKKAKAKAAYDAALESGDSFKIDTVKIEWKALGGDDDSPTTPVAGKRQFDRLQVSSSPFEETTSDIVVLDDLWVDPWTDRREKAASACGRYNPATRYARCCITGVWGNKDTVVGAYILPLKKKYKSILESLDMQETDLHSVRNVIPMLKTIRQAYDKQQLCFVPDEDSSKYTVKILDWKRLANKFCYANKRRGPQKFRDIAGTKFELPTYLCRTPDHPCQAFGPFTNYLNLHTLFSYTNAIEKKWIKESELVQPKHVSPLKSDIIAWVEGASAFDDRDDYELDESD